MERTYFFLSLYRSITLHKNVADKSAVTPFKCNWHINEIVLVCVKKVNKKSLELELEIGKKPNKVKFLYFLIKL